MLILAIAFVAFFFLILAFAIIVIIVDPRADKLRAYLETKNKHEDI